MFLSRHQLQEALLGLDLAQKASRCSHLRDTDMKEQWNDAGEFEVVPNPDPTYDPRGRRTNAEPLATPHGGAFYTIDPETLEVKCAACAEKGR